MKSIEVGNKISLFRDRQIVNMAEKMAKDIGTVDPNKKEKLPEVRTKNLKERKST